MNLFFWPALLLVGAFAACAPVPGCGNVPGDPALTAQLYLGGDVGAADWQRFLDAEVTPRFPDGLSVLAADGQWRNPSGRQIREQSRILVIVMPRTPATIAAIEAVAAAYKARFSQQSVGVVFENVCAAF